MKNTAKLVEFIVARAKPFNGWMLLAQAIPLLVLLGLFSLLGMFILVTLGKSFLASIMIVMPIMTVLYMVILLLLWISESLSLRKKSNPQ